MVGFCIIFFFMQNCLWVIFCPFSNMNTCRQFYHLNKLTQILQQDEITKKIYFTFLARYCKWETFWGQTFFLKASSVVAQRNLMALKEQKAWYIKPYMEFWDGTLLIKTWKGSMEQCSIVFYLSTDTLWLVAWAQAPHIRWCLMQLWLWSELYLDIYTSTDLLSIQPRY